MMAQMTSRKVSLEKNLIITPPSPTMAAVPIAYSMVVIPRSSLLIRVRLRVIRVDMFRMCSPNILT